jgi:hypothetical protein
VNSYPPALAYGVARHRPEEFSAALSRALADGFDLERAVTAFRWYASLQIRSVVHLDPLEPVAMGDGHSIVRAAATRRSVGRTLPQGAKEFVAMRLQRRRRSQEIDDIPLEDGAVESLLLTIDSLRGDGEVWEPYMSLPRASDPATERELVNQALRRLSARLALDDLRGVGALASAGLRGALG